MTAKKPKDKKLKRGPKPDSKKKETDRVLKQLYFQDGITYTHAAEIAKCDVEHASLMFKKFGDDIQTHKEDDADWIERNDRVRERALEGLSIKIKKSDTTITRMEEKRKKINEIQQAILPDLAQKVEDTEVGQVILEGIDKEKIVWKDVLELQKILNKDLNLFKNFGYYVTTLEERIHTENIFNAELQVQYDTIEILPPPSEVLNREIEKRIADKQKLKQPMPAVVQQKPAKELKKK